MADLAPVGWQFPGGLAQVIPTSIAGSQALSAGIRGAAGSAITQGIAVATGLQKRFDWAGVAAAGIGAGVSSAVGGAFGVDPLSTSAGNIGRTLVANAAGGIANAATCSIVSGTSFGDNLIAALPDVIASTVGSVVSASVERARAPKLKVDPDALDDGGTVTGGSLAAIEQRIAELRASGRASPETISQVERRVAEIKRALAAQRTEEDRANGAGGVRLGSDGKPILPTRDVGYAIDLSTLGAWVQQYNADYSTGRYSADGLREFNAAIENNRRLIVQWDRAAEAQINREFGGILLGSAGAALVGVVGAGVVAAAGWSATTTFVANAGVAGLSSTAGGLGYRPALGETNTVSTAIEDFGLGVAGFGAGAVIGRVGSNLIGRIGVGQTATSGATTRGLSGSSVVSSERAEQFLVKNGLAPERARGFIDRLMDL